ncbi:hypothetical protein M8C21_020981 [Ambrosia artemisiifolia]|uniref:Uncharacterized protein n=1 Tax=Ambrosia artemisiifolia TaxID=4212 RepID=A0AAD5CBN6_AMBAR|nr:hypothetical protein M8C21_020981 [Ambrosia artemisiifolia]
MIMGLFHHQEPASNPSKKYRFFKDALATCHTFCRKISSHSLQQHDDHGDDDEDVIDYDDEQEIFVSAVLSKYKESKSKRKVGLTVDSFIWELEFELGLGNLSPTEPRLTRKEIHHAYASDVEDHRPEEFYSPCSHLSRCSSDTTAAGAFVSVKTNLSRCSSMSSFEFPVFKRRRRSMLLELCHCEGWPFGLCRKALLVPPLPKSPSESWMWRKSSRLVKIP